MRLLRREHDKFVVTDDLPEPPSYAILSHTWGDTHDELTYQDVRDGVGNDKIGYAKLMFCATQAARDHLEHFWIDTCCIDKRNDAELSTAIRSMFRWYAEARVCYVYLTDALIEADVRQSRWLTRGWTLQELIAPRDVQFYSRDGKHLGSRASLRSTLHESTGIDVGTLQGQSLDNQSHATRLQWAASRTTKLPEDQSYSLMGICGVTMSPRYGEGKDEARRRLESKISKRYGSIALDTTFARPLRTNSNELMIGLRKAKLDRLKFEATNGRRSMIKKPSPQTCKWMLVYPVFESWLSSDALSKDNGFLWIKGKPGTGKSVLTKYLDEHTCRSMPSGDICISFYFNARGSDSERSLKGMYRSLLVQLLKTAPNLQTVLDDQNVADDEDDLKRLLLISILKLRRQLWIFIDALDECGGADAQDIITYFQDVRDDAFDEDISVRVCFASRHYPIFDIPTGLQIDLDDVTHHVDDLVSYIRNKLRVGTEAQARDVEAGIMSRANSSFLWVVLVVEKLNKEFRNGRVHDVRRRVDETPNDLVDLFNSMIHRDNENIDECMLCIKWILYARRPLMLPEFYFAMMAGTSNGMQLWSLDQVSEQQMESYLVSTSKGLAELTKETVPKIQFIHESVRDYLLLGRGLEHLSAGTHSAAECHEALKMCCFAGLTNVRVADLVTLSSAAILTSLPTFWIEVSGQFPFLEYAMSCIFYHAEQACSSVSQKQFVDGFGVEYWRTVHNLLQLNELDKYEPGLKWQTICADQGLLRLLACVEDSQNWGKSDDVTTKAQLRE